MDEEIERLVVSVRADTGAFRRDVAAMRGELEGPFAAGADRAGRAIEAGLLRAVRGGRLGFDELRRTALSVMAEIGESAIRAGIGSIAGGRGGGGGIAALLTGLLTGRAGRATGGPVSPHVPYMVGERGPELFVPTAAGRVEVPGAAPVMRPVPASFARGARDVRVAITVRATGGGADAPAALARSGRQVARAVRAALADGEGGR